MDLTPEEIEKKSPRKLFELAMKCEIDYGDIQDQDYGISNLYIGEIGEDFLQIVAEIQKTRDQMSKFDLSNLGENNRHAIYFYLSTKMKHRAGLMEIDNVGFLGTDSFIRNRYLLYPEDFIQGTVNLIQRLLDIFPGFLNQVYIDIYDRRFIGIFEGLGQLENFLRLRELTVLKYMDIGMWAALVEGLEEVNKVTMGKESSFGDIEDNHSVKHLIIENGSILDPHRFIAMNYEILEVKNFNANFDDIQEFIQGWKNGEKWNLKFLNLKFKKEMRTDDYIQLKNDLGGRKRKRNTHRKMVFKLKNRIYSLRNAMDIKPPECFGSYILTKTMFQFFCWKSPPKKEKIETDNEYIDDSDDSDYESF